MIGQTKSVGQDSPVGVSAGDEISIGRETGVLPLTADIVFKYVLGAEGSAFRLRAFLSAVQDDTGYPAWKEVSIENPFNLKQSLTDKGSIIDVRALDTEGRQYNIEVQAQTQKAFRERTLYSCSVPKFRLRRPMGRYHAIEA